eukprot:TRINITY_DN12411_c0_g1_i22.p1 TRINITY_DN12411_c0_g1~~TRINITY_DN12411_c0_g1_i22.p1  ORF type:complete len:202 (+),score=9.40 TRINITY_DN12411_c0_g1_i22:1004-1609(+)
MVGKAVLPDNSLIEVFEGFGSTWGWYQVWYRIGSPDGSLWSDRRLAVATLNSWNNAPQLQSFATRSLCPAWALVPMLTTRVLWCTRARRMQSTSAMSNAGSATSLASCVPRPSACIISTPRCSQFASAQFGKLKSIDTTCKPSLCCNRQYSCACRQRGIHPCTRCVQRVVANQMAIGIVAAEMTRPFVNADIIKIVLFFRG